MHVCMWWIGVKVYSVNPGLESYRGLSLDSFSSPVVCQGFQDGGSEVAFPGA